ncbi:MAG: ATP-binding protein, partial [Nitrospinales bacterium]
KAALRMESFIEDLLRFSRINTHAQPYAPVKLEEVAFEVIEDLEELILQTKGKVTVNALPVVNGDRLQIKQLLLNVVSNALKFSQPGKPPEVSLNSRIDEVGNWDISIHDNGRGFDEKYMSKIFKPFGRLGKNDECGGTGMGLAICKKIVKRHGGRIVARSKPGEGSTFTITFPEKRLKSITRIGGRVCFTKSEF